MTTPSNESGKPRIGLPYRTGKEELTRDRSRYELYVDAIRGAGGEPIEVSLGLTGSDLAKLAHSLDAIVLPGSPADVDPARFDAPRHPKCADPDREREATDLSLLDQAFAERKPVLAICYGIQSLNVFLGGSLLQDIASERHATIQHSWDRASGAPEPFHSVLVETGSYLSDLAAANELRVNSSHHQSILEPGRGLRVVARAGDGLIEAVEGTGCSNLVMGVQWHPERMVESDPVARALFSTLVTAAKALASAKA